MRGPGSVIIQIIAAIRISLIENLGSSSQDTDEYGTSVRGIITANPDMIFIYPINIGQIHLRPALDAGKSAAVIVDDGALIPREPDILRRRSPDGIDASITIGYPFTCPFVSIPFQIGTGTGKTPDVVFI